MEISSSASGSPVVNNTGTLNISNTKITSSGYGTLFNNNEGGTFTSSDGIAENFGESGIITIAGGAFTSSKTAFKNSSLASESSIIIDGGKITSQTVDYILGSYNSDNSIEIYDGEINAPNSKGILLSDNCYLSLGADEGTVSQDSPAINIQKGGIFTSSSEKAYIDFYDGYIHLAKRFSSSDNLVISTPETYQVAYSNELYSTYKAHLEKNDDNSSAPIITKEKDGKNSSTNTTSNSSNNNSNDNKNTKETTVQSKQKVSVPNTLQHTDNIYYIIGLITLCIGTAALGIAHKKSN